MAERKKKQQQKSDWAMVKHGISSGLDELRRWAALSADHAGHERNLRENAELWIERLALCDDADERARLYHSYYEYRDQMERTITRDRERIAAMQPPELAKMYAAARERVLGRINTDEPDDAAAE